MSRNENELIFDILHVLRDLPSYEEKFVVLAHALLVVSGEELGAAWADGKFNEVQSQLVERLETMRHIISAETDVELFRWRSERERAIEEGDKAELERLNQEIRRRTRQARNPQSKYGRQCLNDRKDTACWSSHVLQTLSKLHPRKQPVLSPVRSSIKVRACSRSTVVMDLYDPSICGDLVGGGPQGIRGPTSAPQS